jgi:type I restriction enzyme S subunit
MHEGSDSWPEARLGNLSTFIGSGITPHGGSKVYLSSGVPFLRSQNVHFGGLRLEDVAYISPDLHAELDRTHVRTCDVLLNITGASIGRCTTVPESLGPANVNQHVCIIRVDPTKLAGHFLAYFLESGRGQAQISERQAGLSREALNYEQVRSFSIPIPPLPEQRKIAAILSSVDDTIAKTQSVIDQLEIIKRGLLGELLTRGLPGRHNEFRETALGMLPVGWSTLTYGELAAPIEGAIQSGPFGSALKHSEFTESGCLVIGIDNVLDGRFSIGSNHRIPEDKFQELKRFQARPLDLLMTVMATVGRCCVVPANIEPAIITKHVYRLTVDPKKANSYFLMYCLYGVPRLAQEVRGSAQGLSRPGLNKSLLLPLRFPIPPLEEQEEIVQVLQGVEDRLKSERRALESMMTLKAGLLDALLSGKVRVAVSEQEAA